MLAITDSTMAALVYAWHYMHENNPSPWTVQNTTGESERLNSKPSTYIRNDPLADGGKGNSPTGQSVRSVSLYFPIDDPITRRILLPAAVSLSGSPCICSWV